MKTKKFKAIRVSQAITKEEFLALAAKDKRKHTSMYKQVPEERVAIAKFHMVGGVPHKMVDGVLVPLTKKA